MVRRETDQFNAYRDGKLTRYTQSGKSSQSIEGHEAIARMASEVFHLPAARVAAALAAQEQFKQS